jgi:hypothetical protein
MKIQTGGTDAMFDANPGQSLAADPSSPDPEARSLVRRPHFEQCIELHRVRLALLQSRVGDG